MLSIGEFSHRTHLSPKALRLYDQLGLVTPAMVDPSSGYRWYDEDQIERARLVALLRRLEMPLAEIIAVVDLEPDRIGTAVEAYWARVESVNAERRALVRYVRQRSERHDRPMLDIQRRTVQQRGLLTMIKHIHIDAAGAFLGKTLQQLRAAAPGLHGIEGLPFVVYYGEVSADSDGPVEICRPVELAAGRAAIDDLPGFQLREEPTHDEAFIRLTMGQLSSPDMMAALEALEHWVDEHGERPLSPARQVLIADWRTATADTPACDLAVPLG